MEVVATVALQDGQILAEDIMMGGNVAIKKGTKIDSIVKQKLQAFKLMSVTIMEPSDFAETYYEKVRLSKEFKRFKEIYRENLIAYKVSVDSFIYNKVPFRFPELKEMAWRLCPDNLLGKTLFAYINLMVPESEETMSFAHGLNVALICKIMARWFNLNPHDTELLVYSGFLYDVGKFLLPQEIIWKPQKLSKMEYDLIKTHCFHGYYLLSKSFGVDEHIKNAVLQHHERVDGSGYPQGITGNEIDPFAKMIAIADVYEAMTSPRTYRDPMCPYKAIQIIEDESLQKYDTYYITTFLQHIVDELIGNKVRLSNGMEGEVLLNNRNDLSRPVVKCGEQIVDLSQNRSIGITAII